MKKYYEKRRKVFRLLFFAIVAFSLAFVSGIYLFMMEYCRDTVQVNTLSLCIQQAIVSKKVCLLAIGLFSGFVIYDRFGTKFFEFLYSYRYIIALAVFVFCVIFELNGSSIGMWTEYLGGEDTGNILGVSRRIRTDEWAVSTPMMLSQYYNASGQFPYFSDTVRGTATDMFIVYSQPVKDIAMIFKPFYWGYLFLSAGKGLAFFWYGKWIILFLVSFEMIMLITKENRLLSVAGSCFIALAPPVQWWYANSGLVEMLIYGQLSVLLLRKYMLESKMWVRVLYVSAISICAGGFILLFYPAWQFPMAYVILGLGIWVIVDNYQNCVSSKKDIVWIVAILAIFMGIMIHVWINSKETIELVMNTAYPGKRQELGGGILVDFFNYTSNIWYALFGVGTGPNVCESTQFIDFFPLCYIVPLHVLIKKKDKLIAILFCIAAFFTIWCVFGFPAILAKLTCLSFSPAERTFIILGFVNILLLMRGISMFDWKCSALRGGILAVIGGYTCVKIGSSINKDFYPNNRFYVYTIIIWILFFYLLIRLKRNRNQIVFCGFSIVIMIFSGVLVNPVRQGVDVIYENQVVQMIKNAHMQDKEALWAIEEGLPVINAGIMVGAPTINSTNVYPCLERWRLLDEEGRQEKTYNRYAHIKVEIKEKGKAKFIATYGDGFTISLTVEDLKRLNVKYVMSGRGNLEELGTDKVDFSKIDKAGNYYVYKIQ